MRATATRVYSRAWDQKARKDLEALLDGASRAGSGAATIGRTRTAAESAANAAATTKKSAAA
jgi:hypothetical protein